MEKVKNIGLAIDAVGAYGRGVIRGIMAYCQTNPSWRITIEPRWSFMQMPNPERWDVDGIIVQISSVEAEGRLMRRRKPVVNISNFRNFERLPAVIPDDAAIAVMAADYLVDRGFAHYGFCGPGDLEFARLRLRAFQDRLAERGFTCSLCNTINTDIIDWLRSLPKPVAVLGCNDDWAHHVLNACRTLSLRVPDQVAVLGVDDDELFNTLVSPSLSSIEVPTQKIGFEAAALLDRMMNNEKVGRIIKHLPPRRVVSRASTDVVALQDADLATAIRYIRDHAHKPLRVSDLLDHITLSRRTLERRFREEVGHSVQEEMQRVHIERSKSLLLTTDMSMAAIALHSGFTSATRFGIAFRREMGTTPGEFRTSRRISTAGELPGAKEKGKSKSGE